MKRQVAGDFTDLPLRIVFAKNVRIARIAAGTSQEGLAAQAGLDRTFVSSLERGLRNISIDNVELLGQALGISAHDLLNPMFAIERNLDVEVTRSPRTARPYPVAPKKRTGRSGAKSGSGHR